MGEFQEMGFRILAGSICILRNISINSCKSNKQQFRIHSQSLLKNPGGGQDKPAGIGCPPPVYGEFQEMGFRILAGSICFLRNISINSCNSN